MRIPRQFSLFGALAAMLVGAGFAYLNTRPYASPLSGWTYQIDEDTVTTKCLIQYGFPYVASEARFNVDFSPYSDERAVEHYAGKEAYYRIRYPYLIGNIACGILLSVCTALLVTRLTRPRCDPTPGQQT